jgi:hypothetical protein
MITTAPLSFDRANEQVEGMIREGTPFARVEDAIEATQFSQPHKAALWLLAWSLRDPTAQRNDARLMAEVFSADRNEPARVRGRATKATPVFGRPLRVVGA